jgi:hypothetical protein
MVYIKVLVDTINKETVQQILDYYNEKKSKDENPLERLDRAEGGFKIGINKDKWEKDHLGYTDANLQIQQVRWSNGRLVGRHKSLNMKQYMLLYDALVYALPGNVILEQ